MNQVFLPRQNDFAPTRDEVHAMLMALAPRGRAWQTDDVSGARQDSVLKSFWYAVAGVWRSLETAVSATLTEWSPASTSADRDLWMTDYGLPDACLPTGDDLVAAVRAGAGTAGEDWVAFAASLGIVAQARWLKGNPLDPDYPGVTATLVMTLSTVMSFSAAQQPPHAGNWQLGVQRLGDLNVSRIVCMLEACLPAHIDYIIVLA